LETAAVLCYGTSGWGSYWKLHQCDFTAPVARGVIENCRSALLRHRWLGVCLESAPVRFYGSGGWRSDWKLQQCDFTAPVAGGVSATCSSAMIQNQLLRV